VSARPVGEDQLAPRQPLDRVTEIRVELDRDHFEDVFDIAAADFVPKPERSTYERFLRTHGVEPDPLVRISLRPGSRSIASPRSGSSLIVE
jgi:hypothetical protein